MFAATVPLTRTVTLPGRLVPERTVRVRAGEAGLLTDLLVAAGDTVAPGQLVARLRSPSLDQALRAHPAAPPVWPLLARRARLDVHAPPWARERADGTVDPASIFAGGVVLTRRLDRLRGARVSAGDAVLDLAATDRTGRVPFVVDATADERHAQRVRPGMPARVLIAAVPHERPRQIGGVVRHVSPASDAGGWRVRIAVDTRALEALPPNGRPTRLRPGYSVRVAVVERRETLARTAARWTRTKWADAQIRLPESR